MTRAFYIRLALVCIFSCLTVAAFFGAIAGFIGFAITAIISAFLVGWTGWGLTLGLFTIGAFLGIGVTIRVLVEGWDGYKSDLYNKMEKKRIGRELHNAAMRAQTYSYPSPRT